jgi:hypothetical protein
MPEQPVLDVLCLEGLPEERVFLQVNHAERQVITGAPVCMNLTQLVGAERCS